jgi:hypothetical protein
MPRPDHAGGPKKHRLMLELPRELAVALKDASEANGMSPKMFVLQVLADDLGVELPFMHDDEDDVPV